MQTQAIMLDTIYIGHRRTRRSGLQKRENLRKHYADIVRICFINITHLRTTAHSAYSIPLEVLEIEILTIKYRAKIMTIPTIITALFIATVPMWAASLPTYPAQTAVTRARDFTGYHIITSFIL